MKRALLRCAELRRADGQHRPALDEGLDHRARVDAHDGCGKVDRVVVKRLVLRGHRQRRPLARRDRGVGVGQRHLRPFRGVPGMRPDEHPQAREGGLSAPAQRLEPAEDERDLLLRRRDVP